MRLALLALLLSGCANAPPSGVARSIVWVQTENSAEMCAKLLPRQVLPIAACSNFRGEHCVIYAEVPKDNNDRRRMLYLGHEVLHCFVGDFHG